MQSSFTLNSGRDVYLDFNIEAKSKEILHAGPKSKFHKNISIKKDLILFEHLARDDSIVFKTADKSVTVVIMNKCEYITEVELQVW